MSNLIFAGDTNKIKFRAISETGAVLNLNGILIEWALSTLNKTSVIIQKTSPAGVTVTDAANGLFEINLLPAETVSLNGDYYHEVQITDTENKISTIYTGRIRINHTIIIRINHTII